MQSRRILTVAGQCTPSGASEATLDAVSMGLDHSKLVALTVTTDTPGTGAGLAPPHS